MVALSATKVEYMVATKVIKKGLWFKDLVSELLGHRVRIIIYCDNQSVFDTNLANHVTKSNINT